jgi:PAS domain S-box-containing protein
LHAHLASIVESSDDAIISTLLDGAVTSWNPAAERLFGYRASEMMRRPIARLIPEDRWSEENQLIEQLEIGLRINHFETVWRAKDGRLVDISLTVSPIRNAEGRIAGISRIARDITERKWAEEFYLRFVSILNSATDAIISVNEDQQIVLFNLSAQRMFGYTATQAIDAPMQRLVAQRSRETYQDRLAQLDEPSANGNANGTVGDLNCLRADGTEFPAETTISRTIVGGKKLHTVILRDVTERRRVEQMHLHFRALFESLPGSYVVLTPDFKIVAVSNAYLASTMTKREQLLGQNIFDAFPDNPENNANGAANLRASLERVRVSSETDTMAIQRYDVRRPDGGFEVRYWSPVNSPVLGAERRLEYIVHRVEDVTAFVLQREQPAEDGNLRARMEQMEAEVFHSSQELQAVNARLGDANKELEAFSYSVSHDLRAPLRHVQGYASMLAREMESQLTDKGRRYLKTITDASGEMGELIDDLLTFSRMGRAQMVVASVSMDDVVRDTLRSLEPSTEGRRIDWRLQPLPTVQGDPAMLKVVLTNLIGNAIKYSSGRDCARIEIGTAGSEDGQLVFFVKDNGAGFDPQYTHKLFGVFQRLHHSDEFEGTGIGLANVRRIIGRHGGKTWAEGEIDRGATFYFTLHPPPKETAS